MKRFFDTPPAEWASPRGKLHVYAVPPAPVQELAAEYHAAMRRHPRLVSIQPPQWLHMTVQLIDVHQADVEPCVLDKLAAVLRTELAGVPVFHLTMGPAVIGVHGITLRTPPPADEFTALVQHTRTAITDVLGDAAVAPGGANQNPHASLGYGVAAGDSDPLIRDLNDLWRAPVTFAVDEVQLVAVDQDATAGIYTWTTLATIPLGTATAQIIDQRIAADARAWEPLDDHSDAPVVRLYEGSRSRPGLG